MRKKLLSLGMIIGLCFVLSGKVMAGGFNLQSISGVDTSGRQLSHWWFSGSQAIFRGEAAAGATIGISIDGNQGSVVADASGNWSYESQLEGGDHQVVLNSNGSEISFTLTTGAENVDWEAVNNDKGTESLPAAGVVWPGVVAISLGIGGIIKGGKMWREIKK